MLSPNARAWKERIFSMVVRLKIGKKGALDKYFNSGPPSLIDELSAIKCSYKLDLTKSNKKVQFFRIGGAQYVSIISMTQMIYRSKDVELTCGKLLEEVHNQWGIAGNMSQDKKDSDNEDEVAATATTKDKHSGKKKPYVNPNKERTCNHCKKKGHVENKCWKNNPELIPDKVKAAWKKQAEKKAEKTSTTATAFEDEDKMVLRYDACIGGSLSNAVNLILRICLYYFLHTMSS
jgi:hypothetical protein